MFTWQLFTFSNGRWIAAALCWLLLIVLLWRLNFGRAFCFVVRWHLSVINFVGCWWAWFDLALRWRWQKRHQLSSSVECDFDWSKFFWWWNGLLPLPRRHCFAVLQMVGNDLESTAKWSPASRKAYYNKLKNLRRKKSDSSALKWLDLGRRPRPNPFFRLLVLWRDHLVVVGAYGFALEKYRGGQIGILDEPNWLIHWVALITLHP